MKQLQQQLAGKEKELATFVAQAISLKDEVSSLKQELVSSKQSLASAHAHHTAQVRHPLTAQDTPSAPLP